ncbi:uncharacterized protein PHALS_02256 [Plasmopara halstedii]|uniref:Uncharacterized protein n=1 Tax=Plasmopara halstedii TaxID=4781 RepID=A0A0N7L729_PLAHL|nr:uncharacterized protein PHALS_02256 [Plasmopara halstedii]CEG45923.1 hypothetical protein PHALS_02256 [Plasmopara halstedii]|eukprot:XP_024582292.1 hypothetical protein PHALS_02256 [Plasmopara halstedii]
MTKSTVKESFMYSTLPHSELQSHTLKCERAAPNNSLASSRLGVLCIRVGGWWERSSLIEAFI